MNNFWLNSHQSFEDWCEELDSIAIEKYEFQCNLTETTGKNCWWTYYDEGWIPEDALLEDMSYA